MMTFEYGICSAHRQISNGNGLDSRDVFYSDGKRWTEKSIKISWSIRNYKCEKMMINAVKCHNFDLNVDENSKRKDKSA